MLNTDHSTRQIRYNQWKNIIETAYASGQENRNWCRQNNVSERQFYYWQRKIRAAEAEKLLATKPESPVPLPANVEPQLPTVSFVELPQELATCKDVAHERFSVADKRSTVAQQLILNTGEYSLLLNDAVSEQLIIKVLRAIRNA